MKTATVRNIDGEVPYGELEKLYREHQKAIFRSAYSVTGNAQDAEDVLQTDIHEVASTEDGSRVSEESQRVSVPGRE